MTISEYIRFVYCALRGIPILGIDGSLKFLAAATFARDFRIRPRGYKQSLLVRGGTSDTETFYSIIIRRAYPVHSGNIKTVIDAGANVGYSAAFFSSIYPDAVIYALEPEHANYDVLVDNTKLSENIVPLRLALWNKSEDLYLQNKEAESWAFQFGEGEGESQKTPALSLSDLMDQKEIEKIDILKIDIEGAEKEVFSGDVSWLDHVSCLYIETHDRFVEGAAKQVFTAMSKYRYQFDIRYEYAVFDKIQRIDVLDD